MSFEFWHITLVAAFFFAILELFATSFFFLGIAFGCLVTAFVQWVTGDADFYRDTLIVAVGSVISFWAFRFFFKKPKDTSRLQDNEDINRY